MPTRKLISKGMGLEGAPGIGSGIGAGVLKMQHYDDSSSSDEEEGGGLYGSGVSNMPHVHHHHIYVLEPDIEGQGINWKKIGRTISRVAKPIGREIVKVGKPILKEISHKYLPKLAGETGEFLGAAGAEFLGQPELAPMGADLGKSLGSKLGTAADKKIQGLGMPRKGRFVKGSPEAKEWAASMREKRQMKMK
jgi:hypothetical protein